MSFVETALAFKSKLRAASPCGYYEGPEHEYFIICTSRPMGPTNPAFSRNSKLPPLGGGVFTTHDNVLVAALNFKMRAVAECVAYDDVGAERTNKKMTMRKFMIKAS